MKSKIAGVFGLRLAYSVITFLTSVLFARILGKTGLGIYNYSVVWAYLLSVPATIGFDNFLVREMAVYQTRSSWQLMRGLLNWADKVVLIASVSLAAISILIASFIYGGAHSDTFVGFCMAMAFMPALSLRNVRRGAMRGLNHITKGLIPECLIDPLILASLTLVAYAILRNRLTASWVIAFYGIGSTVTLMIVSQFLKQALPQPARVARPDYKGKLWLSGALPFMVVESIPILNARLDTLMLGAIKGTDAVGLYDPINRGAYVVTFILMAVGSSLAPAIASAYADNRLADLQRMITRSVRLVTGVAFLFAITLVVCSHWYLLLFGPEFVQGQTALYIFCAGTFTATATGLAPVILNMTGHERFIAVVSWISISLNVALNAAFIPLWGIEGAALATSIATTAGALISLVAVKRKLGIDATVVGMVS